MIKNTMLPMTGKAKAVAAVALIMIALLAGSGIANAQGSRKDDIVFNAQGRPMAGATVRVCTSSATGQPCAPLAPVYSDAALTQALANPLATDGLGNYTFYAAPGRYMIEFSGPGITTKQIPNVILPSDPSSPTFTSVTTTSGISAFSLSLTGNLTVNGSTAVVGSLTVGGAPVPSTNADNQWNGAQRFKGPIPYRDFTSYMPAGGCSVFNYAPANNATGSISGGTSTLSLTFGAADWKNGCGITIEGAGPTSTLVTPACATVTTATRAGNVVTITCSALTNLKSISSDNDLGVVISGCSDSSYNGTTSVTSGGGTAQFTYNATGADGSTSGCSASFLFGWAHGVTGSTTYYYKVAPIDSGGGMGAAVGPTVIANGNATLSTSNYNWIAWPNIANARMEAIYRSLDNVTYTCVGVSFSTHTTGGGYSDWGYNAPCPQMIPATPPTSPTAQALTTTIVSGAGTSSLVLAANASNTATARPTFHDEMPFLTQCVNDVNADQSNTSGGGYNAGSAGCMIPYGVWHFNSDFPSDTISTTAGGVTIQVAGTLYMEVWPWIISKGFYSVVGLGFSGGGGNFINYPTTAMTRGRGAVKLPAFFVITASAVDVEGFFLQNGEGHGIVIYGAAGVKMKRMLVGMASDATGVPIYIGGGSFRLQFEDINLTPNPSGFPATVLFSGDTYNSVGVTDVEFRHMTTVWHHFYVNAPGGQAGSGFDWSVNDMVSEEHGQYPTGGFVTQDTGDTHGGARIAAVSLRGFQNADASNKTFLTLLGQNLGGFPVVFDGVDQFNPMVQCDTTSTSCATGKVGMSISSNSNEFLTGLQKGYSGPLFNGNNAIAGPLTLTSGNGNWLNTPPSPFIADALPAPNTISVTGTGAGSLSAGTYCIKIVGLDAQGTPGQTLPSPEVCQTVGASSSIALQWTTPTGFTGWMYANYQLWWGTSAGNENQFISTSIAPGGSSTIAYTFTSTAGATSATLPKTPTAYMSWLYRDNNQPSCLYCLPGGSSLWQLGIGEPSPPSGDKLAVKGGVLDAENGFKSALATKSSSYTLTTADYWVNVTGTTTITVPHASIGNHWVVFNSGAGTVTVQADSGNINGGANITLAANTGKEIACDGTNCFAH